MTNKEFQTRLQEMYEAHPLIAKREKKTVNELFYVLRRDDENDYNINVNDNGFMVNVSSVKESFVPVRILAKHVKKVTCEEDYGYAKICLVLVTEK